jgi:hypothetical protein
MLHRGLDTAPKENSLREAFEQFDHSWCCAKPKQATRGCLQRNLLTQRDDPLSRVKIRRNQAMHRMQPDIAVKQRTGRQRDLSQ